MAKTATRPPRAKLQDSPDRASTKAEETSAGAQDEDDEDEAAESLTPDALAPIVADAEVLPVSMKSRRRRKTDDEADEDEEDEEADSETSATAAAAADETRLAPLRSPVQRFLAEARAYPRLSDEEEKRLIKEVREKGDKNAARTLVVHNLRLVISIAYQYRQAWTNVLDLFQEGSVGLLEAVKHWDPTLGTRFGSYAAYWIRAYILRFLMTNARLIHVGNTRAGRKLFFRLERERQKLLAAGVDVTPKLLAAKLDVAVEDVEEVAAHLASREVSFDPRPDDEGLGLEERIPGAGRSPESQAARSEMSATVARLMTEFAAGLTDERERTIWREHLAAAEDAVPLGALGERFGVSKQRMGQIADKLKKRFREKILQDMGNDIQLEWTKGSDS
jgi:RNA polymerase sigma-32 factor